MLVEIVEGVSGSELLCAHTELVIVCCIYFIY